MAAKLNFGKYRGRSIEEIRSRDPQYIEWAINTVSGFAEIAAKAKNITRKAHRSRCKAKVGTIQLKPAKRPQEWHYRDNRPNPVMDAINNDPVLAYCHPRELYMPESFAPNQFDQGDDPPY